MKTPSPRLHTLLIAAVVSLQGCASGGPASNRLGRIPASGAEVLYPEPPAPTRIQFLMAISGQGDIEGRDGGGAQILKPYGMALHAGRLLVCDTDLHGLVVFDLQRQTFERVVPGGQAQLRTPINCTVDRETGHLYVVDTDRADVVVLDTAFAYVDHIQVEGGRPGDVFVDGDTLWISDMARRVVDVYVKDSRRLVRTIGPGESGTPSAIPQPTNIFVTERRLYVSDFGSFAVKVFERDGTFVRQVGSFGRQTGQFLRPKGIAVDREERLWVVDAAFNNVQVFDDEGKFMNVFGDPGPQLGGLDLPAKLILSYDPAELRRFQRFVLPGHELEFLIFVTSQFGPNKISVYGFLTPPNSASSGAG